MVLNWNELRDRPLYCKWISKKDLEYYNIRQWYRSYLLSILKNFETIKEEWTAQMLCAIILWSDLDYLSKQMNTQKNIWAYKVGRVLEPNMFAANVFDDDVSWSQGNADRSSQLQKKIETLRGYKGISSPLKIQQISEEVLGLYGMIRIPEPLRRQAWGE